VFTDQPQKMITTTSEVEPISYRIWVNSLWSKPTFCHRLVNGGEEFNVHRPIYR